MTVIISSADADQIIEKLTNQDLYIQLQAIINTAIDGIITINKQGVIESANQSAADIFGYSKDEMIGKNVSMLMHSDHARGHDEYINAFLKTREPKIIGIGRVVQGKRKDGSSITFRLAVSEVVLENRTIFTGIIHDVSEVTRAHQKIVELNYDLENKVIERTNELEKVINQLLSSNANLKAREIQLAQSLKREKELNELKSRFVSMASHEFRTPLSTILSSASLISKYQLEEKQAIREKHVGKIKSAVDNLINILNDILSLSKLEEGKVEVTITHFDLIKLGHTVIENLQGILKPGQSIKLIGSDELLIHSNPIILTNILFNLLSNSIKYSKEDQNIELHIEQNQSFATMIVIDFGIGIPEQAQKHIFTRFFRAKNVENIQGTGLGLNIVQSYVELLKGKISFQSEYGKRTEFKVEIPISWEKQS